MATKTVNIHTSSGWQTLDVPVSDDSRHSATFRSDDSPNVCRPLLGMDLYDLPSMQGYYRSFAYACIKKKAQQIANAQIYLYRQFKSKKTEVKDNAFLNLIHSRNSYGQRFPEMLYLSSVNCDGEGNAYLKINFVQTPFSALGNNGKTPVELIPMAAKYVTPVLNSQNTMIQYYRYGYGAGEIKLSPEEVLRFKVPHPESNIHGHAPVSAFNFTLDIDYLMSKWRRVYFKNGTKPSIAVSVKAAMQPEAFNAYVDKMSEKYTGVNNVEKMLIADNDPTITPLNTNNRELDFVNSRDQIQAEIMLILDVNAQVMGIFKDSNYNNSKNARRGWIEDAIQPYTNLVFNEPLTDFVQRWYDRKLITSMEFDLEYDREIQLSTLKFYSQEKIVKKRVIAEMEGFTEEDVPASSLKADEEVIETPAEKATEKITEETE